MGWTIDVRFPAGNGKGREGGDLLSSSPRPDRLWSPPILLSNGYWSPSTGMKRPGREADHPLPSSAEVKE